MNTFVFEMDPEHIKEFLIHQCKIAESLGAVKVMRNEHGIIFFDKNNKEVMRVNSLIF